ncbi:MAG: ABC transporter permease [Lachnospiraceae bacterium]|nr:ABC transporter permease [Lachnospiraceae bacterium]
MVKGLSIKKLILLLTAILTFILFWIVKGIANSNIESLQDQQMYKRWSEDGGYAQISVYLPETVGITPESVTNFEHSLLDSLKKESIESTSENEEARLIASCYTAEGTLSVRSPYASTNLKAVGVGGDFFQFHQFELLGGDYFSESDLNDDYCVLDEVAAWKLFGSNDISGMVVYVGDIPLIVRGVVAQPEDNVSKNAGAGSEMCYVSYRFLTEYGRNDSITDYEIVMPNPVPGYAMGKVKELFGVSEDDMVVVENSDRFSYENRWYLLKNIRYRSMVTQDISYPWWENVARSYEDLVLWLTVLYLALIAYTVVVIIVLLVVMIVLNADLIQAVFIEYVVNRISSIFTRTRGGREEIYEEEKDD